MKRTTGKGFLLVLAACMLLPILASCGKKADSGNGSMRDITLIFYGDKTDRIAEFMAKEMPEFLKQKNLNINLDLQILSWGSYAGPAIELRYASGEDFATMTDMAFMSRCISKGYVLDLTDLIDTYGTNVKREVDADAFKAFSVDGRVYALPLANKPMASVWHAVAVRQDLLEEIGMKEVKTIEDLERFYIESKKLHPDYVGWAGGSDTYGTVRILSRYVSDKNMLFLNELIFTDASADDDKIYSYFESEEFKKYAAIAKRWNQMGIIDSQILSPGNMVNAQFDRGQGLFVNGNAESPWHLMLALHNAVPTGKVKSYFLGDAKGRPLVSRGTYSTGFQVSANAKHPEAYIEIFNQLYADQESYDFMVYGIKGVDYELDASGKLLNRKSEQVFMNDWCAAIAKWMRFASYIDDDVIYEYRHWNDGSILQKDIGFVFNLEPVLVEYAQLQNVEMEYIAPIVLGFEDYDKAYPELLRRLKNAGLDKYVAEYQRQFTEFYRNKK
jgi:putative aldouronate transport system substrate-binding protein